MCFGGKVNCITQSHDVHFKNSYRKPRPLPAGKGVVSSKTVPIRLAFICSMLPISLKIMLYSIIGQGLAIITATMVWAFVVLAPCISSAWLVVRV